MKYGAKGIIVIMWLFQCDQETSDVSICEGHGQVESCKVQRHQYDGQQDDMLLCRYVDAGLNGPDWEILKILKEMDQ